MTSAMASRLVEFHTKMNALDDDIFNITTEALDRVEKDFDGLVIVMKASTLARVRICSWWLWPRNKGCGTLSRAR